MYKSPHTPVLQVGPPQGRHLALRGKPQGRPSEKGVPELSFPGKIGIIQAEMSDSGLGKAQKQERESGETLAYREYNVIGQEHRKREGEE